MRTSEYTEQFDMDRFVAGEPCQDMDGCIRRGAEETRRGVKYIVNGYDNYLASRELLQSAADKQGWKMKPAQPARNEYTEDFDMDRFLAGEPCIDNYGILRYGAKETPLGVTYNLNDEGEYRRAKGQLQASAKHARWKMKPAVLKPWAEYAEKETAEVQGKSVSTRFFEENGVVVLLEMQLEVAPPVGSTVFLTHKNRVSEYEVHRITYHYLAFTPERELACMYVTLRRKSKPL